MSFKDHVTNDLPGFFNTDELAETVIYNNGTEAAEIVAGPELSEIGGSAGSVGTIVVKKTDVPGLAYKQTFIIDGQIWTISGLEKGKGFILAQDNDTYTLQIIRDKRVTQWMK